MTDSLNKRLATSDGRRAFDREIAEFLRNERYREAEALLEAELDGRPGTIAERCRPISLDAVRLSGWEQLDASLTQLGDQVTALGLNLSNYNDSVAGAEWYDKEPAIEVAYYADDAHPFSAASRDELLAACAEPPTPWQGRMLPAGGPPPLAVRGLRLLNSEILLYGNDSPCRPRSSGDLPTAPDEHIAFVLGQWFLHLRFHQAVARDLTARGLGREMPVIIGEHDVGPYVRAIVVAEAHGNPTINPIAAAPATDGSVSARTGVSPGRLRHCRVKTPAIGVDRRTGSILWKRRHWPCQVWSGLRLLLVEGRRNCNGAGR